MTRDRGLGRKPLERLPPGHLIAPELTGIRFGSPHLHAIIVFVTVTVTVTVSSLIQKTALKMGRTDGHGCHQSPGSVPLDWIPELLLQDP